MRVFLILLSLTAAPASAQVMVDGPRGCDLVAGLSGEAAFQANDEEHMIFDFRTLEAIEYRCAFEPAFDPQPAEGEIQVRTGYCMEPGPFIAPGVFTLMDRGDGTAQLDASYSDEPIVFEICATS